MENRLDDADTAVLSVVMKGDSEDMNNFGLSLILIIWLSVIDEGDDCDTKLLDFELWLILDCWFGRCVRASANVNRSAPIEDFRQRHTANSSCEI